MKSTVRTFDPNGPGIPGQLFGLPYTPDTAELVIVPIPWEVTVSYRAGTAGGPQAVLEASSQLDVLVKDIPDAWRLGISMLPLPDGIRAESDRLRHLALQHIRRVEQGERTGPGDPLLPHINESCESMNIYVKATVLRYLKQGKMVGLLGGDHSTPLGFIRALADYYPHFGILHIDAHADLRKAYEGFTYSHASIMYNAMQLSSVSRLVQVGIRDLCEEELQLIRRPKSRIVTFFDEDLKAQRYRGTTWDAQCEAIIRELPEHVYISFDIDGLDPKLCPHTGTPVAGGLEFHEAVYLVQRLVRSGRKIIGFDLNEVSPGRDTDWDANVGARLLYQLCNWTAVSRGRLHMRS